MIRWLLIFAFTLGFLPSADMNGGLSKGFFAGVCSVPWCVLGSSTTLDFCCLFRRLDFTRGLPFGGRLVVVKPKGMGVVAIGGLIRPSPASWLPRLGMPWPLLASSS